MRLINNRTFRLEEFLDDVIPPYAILSHTWGSDSEELTYQNVEQGDITKPGLGSIKFHGCCRQAVKDGFNYSWIDTCCIDKTNSVELSEAINSMFRWYKSAAMCYVYLADVTDADNHQEQRLKLRSSRWFRRGWTLQELLAPKCIEFYDSNWQPLGTKAGLCSVLYQITGVPHRFLRGISDLQTASIAQRMSWAARRETKRKEDIAYCLLGLFDVAMPLIYGEGGEQAFLRLQEQIMKKTRDDSLLAWGIGNMESPDTVTLQVEPGRILATSPSDFANSGQIVPRATFPTLINSLDLSGGSLRVYLPLLTSSSGKTVGLLNCGPDRDLKQVVGIPLAKLAPGSDEYFRPRASDSTLQPTSESGVSPKPIYIRNDIQSSTPTPDESERYLLYDEEGFSDINLSLAEVEPKSCWNEAQAQIMPRFRDDDVVDGPLLILARFRHDEEGSQDFVVLIECEGTRGQCHLFTCARSTSLERLSGKLHQISPKISGQSSASNGLLHLYVSLDFDEQQRKFNLRPKRISTPPTYTFDATTELQRLSQILELEESLNAEARAATEEDEANRRAEEHKSILEQIKAEQYTIDDEHRKLEEKRMLLNEKKSNLLLEMHQLTQRQAEARGKRDLEHKRRLHAQQLFSKFRETAGDDGNGTTDSHDDQASLILGWAAQNGHDRIVHLILNVGANIESRMHGASPLSWAALEGHEIVMRTLLNRGADIESIDETYKATSLSLASRKGHDAAVQLLLDKGASPESRDRTGRTSLSWAASEGGQKTMRLLLQRGVIIDSKDNAGRTPLSWAASEGQEMSIQLLIDEGASIDLEDNCGRTPLSWASVSGHEISLRLLLGAGADRNQKDKKGLSSLLYAASNGHGNVVRTPCNDDMGMTRNYSPMTRNQSLTHRSYSLATGNYSCTARNYIHAVTSYGILDEYEAAIQLLSSGKNDTKNNDDGGWAILVLAAARRHEIIVQLLLNKKVDIESRTPDGLTALSVAAANGHEKIMQLLLDNGANIESPDEECRTPLSLAASRGQTTAVQFLLNRGANIECKDIHGRTPLAIASSEGCVKIVELLLDQNANVESRDTLGRTPLSQAASKGQSEVVNFLLLRGANVEAEDSKGQTPLSVAASSGQDSVVLLLLEYHANIESKDRYGQTPLSLAVINSHQIAAQLLMKLGADIESRDMQGWTPLSLAASNGHNGLILQLLNKGANVESIDKEGWRPLSLAVSNAHDTTVMLLLNRAKIDIKDIDGWTPLLVAASNGSTEIVRLLLLNGASREAADSEGHTPLSVASSNGHVMVVRLLLAEGANARSANKSGQTPLSLSTSNGHNEVVELLEQHLSPHSVSTPPVERSTPPVPVLAQESSRLVIPASRRKTTRMWPRFGGI